MEEKHIICINCPLGCPLTITINEGQVINVSGNTCKRGEVYAHKEISNPTRIVTSTVKVLHGSAKMVSVKTKEDIPKDKIFDCIKALKNITVEAPVHAGDVILKNAANTGIDVIATKSVL